MIGPRPIPHRCWYQRNRQALAKERKIPMGPSILLVEDEPAISDVVKYNLERNGYRVRGAPDGDEALLMIKEE